MLEISSEMKVGLAVFWIYLVLAFLFLGNRYLRERPVIRLRMRIIESVCATWFVWTLGAMLVAIERIAFWVSSGGWVVTALAVLLVACSFLLTSQVVAGTSKGEDEPWIL